MGSGDALKVVAQKSEESQFVARTRFPYEIGKREAEWRIGEMEVGCHILKSQSAENIAYGFLKIVHRDAVILKVALEIDGDTLGDVPGKPPSLVAGEIGSLEEGGGDPVLVERCISPIRENDQGHSVA
jgi:hypothetical protein